MSKRTINDATVLYNGVDLSPYSNSLSGLGAEAEEKDATNWASGGWREVMVGLAKTGLEVQGFYDPETVDPALFSTSAAAFAATLANPSADADIFYFGRFVRPRYTPTFEVGELAKFGVSLAGNSPLIRGKQLRRAVGAAASGDGSIVSVGAASATQKAYALLMVTAITGSPELDVTVYSDGSGFTTPTLGFTFAQMTAPGWQLLELDGAISDTHWRETRVFGGSGTVDYYVLLGVQ